MLYTQDTTEKSLPRGITKIKRVNERKSLFNFLLLYTHIYYMVTFKCKRQKKKTHFPP